MVKCNSIESIEHNSIDISQSKQSTIRRLFQDYFITKIKERELMSKRLSKFFFLVISIILNNFSQ